MSDVIVAAAIAGGVGLAGNITTYLATKRQADANLDALREQSTRELERLAAEHREGERQSRRDIYRAFIASINELDAWAQGLAQQRTRDNFHEWLSDYRDLVAAVRLLNAPPVQIGLEGLLDRLSEFANPLLVSTRTEPFEERVGADYARHRTAVRGARSALIAAMRDDLEAMTVKPES
jgi:hypothetical protein